MIYLKQLSVNLEKMTITYEILKPTGNVISEVSKSNLKYFKAASCDLRSEFFLSDSVRKRWYQVLAVVLKSQGINPSGYSEKFTHKTNLEKFSDDLKPTFFDLKEETVDGKLILMPPSLMDQNDETVKEAINYLIDFYSKLGVDFKEIL